jgi:hypothetical protein
MAGLLLIICDLYYYGLTIRYGVARNYPGGGGIDNGGTLTLTASTVRSNSSRTWAGRLYRGAGGMLTLTASMVRGNSALSGGGLIALAG